MLRRSLCLRHPADAAVGFRRAVGLGLSCCVVLAVSITPGALRADSLSKLSSIESSFSDLRSLGMPNTRAASASSDLGKRMRSGRILFKIGDYLRASAAFRDVLRAKSASQWQAEATWYLGESLLQLGDEYGARVAFQQVLASVSASASFRRYATPSARRIADIAVLSGEFEGLGDAERILVAATEGSEAKPRDLLALGRLKFYQSWPSREAMGEGYKPESGTELSPAHRAAFALLMRIPEDAPEAPDGRFLLGLLATRAADFEAAKSAFEDCLSALEGLTGEHASVLRIQAQLAAARAATEGEDFGRAAELYEAIGPRSPTRPIALFELAYLYARQGNFVRADRASRLLSALQDGALPTEEARMLRARLLLRRGYYGKSEQQFGFVAARMESRLAALEASMARLGSEVHIDVELEEALRPNLRFAYVRGLASELKEIGTELGASIEALDRVKTILAAPEASPLLPSHRDRLRRARVLEHRVLRAIAARVRKRLGAAQLPVSDEAYRKAEAAHRKRVAALQRDVYETEAALLSLRSQLGAVERMQNSAGAAAKAASLTDAVLEVEVQLASLKDVLAAARVWGVLAGPGADETVKLRTELERRASRDVSATELRPALALLERLDEYKRALHDSAKTAVESRFDSVEGFRTMLATLKERTDAMAQEHRAAMLRVAETQGAAYVARVRQLAQQSALGRSDVAWARRAAYRRRLERLTGERADELRLLDDHFREVLVDDSGRAQGAGAR